MTAVEQTIKENRRALAHPNYKGIDEAVLAQDVEIKTHELALEDMTRYGRTLERALLRFHTDKMAQINRIVKELWQKTYRNQVFFVSALSLDTLFLSSCSSLLVL